MDWGTVLGSIPGIAALVGVVIAGRKVGREARQIEVAAEAAITKMATDLAAEVSQDLAELREEHRAVVRRIETHGPWDRWATGELEARGAEMRPMPPLY